MKLRERYRKALCIYRQQEEMSDEELDGILEGIDQNQDLLLRYMVAAVGRPGTAGEAAQSIEYDVSTLSDIVEALQDEDEEAEE